MSRGLGSIERAILARFRRGHPAIEIDDAGDYGTTAHRMAYFVYGIRDHGSERAEIVAVLRAMHSLARKYPDRFELKGGKGRAPLWLVRRRQVRAISPTDRRRGVRGLRV